MQKQSLLLVAVFTTSFGNVEGSSTPIRIPMASERKRIRRPRLWDGKRIVKETCIEKNSHKQTATSRGTGFFYGLSEDLLSSRWQTRDTICKLYRKQLETSLDEGESSLVEKYIIGDRGCEHEISISSDGSETTNARDKTMLHQETGTTTHQTDTDLSDGIITIRDIMFETLDEFRKTADDLRENLSLLRQELSQWNTIQRGRLGQSCHDNEEDIEQIYENSVGGTGAGGENQLQATASQLISRRRKRRREFDNLAENVEDWASGLLFDEGGVEDGWKEVHCMKLLRNKLNPRGTTVCFLKWLPDSRGEGYAREEEKDKLFPCIKCYGTLDAPLEQVCDFLADKGSIHEYNDLVVKHKDIEDISPHSKICWGQCPQILFIKPRDFVTFCSHRWKKDGTQVVINQAVDHEDAPVGAETEGKGRVCRARALRGANFISRDPTNPKKTCFALLAHGDPGGLPTWACKQAIGAVAPVEPFKLFRNLERGIQKAMMRTRPELVSARRPPGCHGGRSNRPGGLSQLGYACFWPDGGGLDENQVDQCIHDGPEEMEPLQSVQPEKQLENATGDVKMKDILRDIRRSHISTLLAVPH